LHRVTESQGVGAGELALSYETDVQGLGRRPMGASHPLGTLGGIL
jgi:hypothetical protein